MPDLKALLDKFRQGDRRSLSRLLTLVGRGEHVSKIRSAIPDSAKSPRVVAITGSAGVGKSTLVGRLIQHIRQQGQTVAVLACDPQSPLTGGALLGDRFRMPGHGDDDGIYIRSLAALSGQGAVAEHLPEMQRLLGAFGFDVVLLETVGAGQGDVTVAKLADVVVLLLQPETGDDLQWEKAGVLEVADIIGIQKADLPGAENVAAQVKAALELTDTKSIPVHLVSAKTGKGVPDLWHAINTIETRTHGIDLDDLLRLAQTALAEKFLTAVKGNENQLRDLLNQWQKNQLTEEQVGEAVLSLLIKL